MHATVIKINSARRYSKYVRISRIRAFRSSSLPPAFSRSSLRNWPTRLHRRSRNTTPKFPKLSSNSSNSARPDSIHVRSAAGKDGTATLVNLNPDVNAWYLLTVAWNGAIVKPPGTWKTPNRTSDRVYLDHKFPNGIQIVEANSRYLVRPV